LKKIREKKKIVWVLPHTYAKRREGGGRLF